MVERLLLVGLGAGIGGIGRYLLGLWLTERFGTAFPYGTLVINGSGSLLLGFLLALAGERFTLGLEARLLLATGFCGGFTTFSTFAYETIVLARIEDLPAATLNVVSNVLLSLLGVLAGGWLARLL